MLLNNNSYLDGVYSTKDGVHFEMHPPLAEPSINHCLAAVDADTLFVAGGWGHIDAAWIYTKTTGWVCNLRSLGSVILHT